MAGALDEKLLLFWLQIKMLLTLSYCCKKSLQLYDNKLSLHLGKLSLFFLDPDPGIGLNLS